MNPADLQELDTIDEDGRAWIAGGLATLVEIGHDAAALWASEVLARALHPAGANVTNKGDHHHVRSFDQRGDRDVPHPGRAGARLDQGDPVRADGGLFAGPLRAGAVGRHGDEHRPRPAHPELGRADLVGPVRGARRGERRGAEDGLRRPLTNLRRSVPQPSDVPVTACQIASGSRTGVAPSVRRDRCLTAATVAVLAPLIPLLARGGWT